MKLSIPLFQPTFCFQCKLSSQYQAWYCCIRIRRNSSCPKNYLYEVDYCTTGNIPSTIEVRCSLCEVNGRDPRDHFLEVASTQTALSCNRGGSLLIVSPEWKMSLAAHVWDISIKGDASAAPTLHRSDALDKQNVL